MAPAIRAQVLPPPQFRWVKTAHAPDSAGSPLGAATRATAIDNSGNVYTAFSFLGPLEVDGQVFPPDNYELVVKRNAQGALLWKQTFGSNAAVKSVKVDSVGSVVVAGNFHGAITVDSLTFQPQGEDFFIAKWNSAGQLVWAKQGGVAFAAYREVTALTLDGSGNAYLVGNAAGNAFFGDTAQIGVPNLTSARTSGVIYCAKFDGTTGDLVWVKGSDNHGLAASGIGSDGTATDVGVDGSGNVVLTGYLPESFTWTNGGQIGTIGTPSNVFWLKLNPDGSFNNGFGANTTVITPPSLAVAADGRSFLGLTVEDSFVLNGTPVTAPPVPGPTRSLRIAIAGLAADGSCDWSQVISPNVSHDYLSLYDLALDNNGYVLFTGGYGGDSLVLGYHGIRLPGTDSGSDVLVGALWPYSGIPLWALPAATGASSVDEGFAISCNSQGLIALAGDFDTDSAVFGSLSVTVPGLNKLFTALLEPNTLPPNRISGTAFVDSNQNGVRDAGEAPVPAGTVFTAGAYGPYVITDSLGQYQLEFGFGRFELLLGEPLLNYQFQPRPALNFRQLGNVVTDYDLALVPIALRPDGRVTLTAYTDAEPGLPLRYRLTVANSGTAPTTGGAIDLNFDSQLLYAGSTLPGATATGQRITAPAPVLLPGERADFDFTFQVPTTTPLNTTLTCNASLTLPNDVALADNLSSGVRQVHASRPAFSFEVDRPQLTPAQVADREWLTYTLRFRNDSATTATDVRVATSLVFSQVHLETVEVLAASHPYTLSVANTGIGFEMRNANLPPFAQNTITSLGFVKFRVRVRDWLPVGADIQLDPVVTLSGQGATALSVLTRVGNVSGLPADAFAAAVQVWPNPARDVVNVDAGNAGPLDITLLDAVGRVVRTARLATGTTTFDVSGLPAGLYTLRATGAAAFTRRISVVTE